MIIKLNYPEYLIFTNCIDSNNLFPAAKVKVNPLSGASGRQNARPSF